jgi:hypothetical protein
MHNLEGDKLRQEQETQCSVVKDRYIEITNVISFYCTILYCIVLPTRLAVSPTTMAHVHQLFSPFTTKPTTPLVFRSDVILFTCRALIKDCTTCMMHLMHPKVVHLRRT